MRFILKSKPLAPRPNRTDPLADQPTASTNWIGILGLALALSAFARGVTAAQEQPPADTTKRETRPSRQPQTLKTISVVGRAARRGYSSTISSTATKTLTPLRDVPQAVGTVTRELISDLGMQSMADVSRYLPGITMGQGEGNRDQPTIRGNGTSGAFFVDGLRDDVQYFRDLYNVERIEGLNGSNSLIFGRGTGGGVLNRVTKQAGWNSIRTVQLQGGSYGSKRGSLDVGQGLSRWAALRINGMYENSDLFRHDVSVERYGINPTATFALDAVTKITASYERFSDHRTADRGIPSYAGLPAPADLRTFFGDPNVSYSDAQVNVGTIGVERIFGSSLIVRNRTRYAHYDKIYQNVFPGAVDSTGASVSLSAYNNAADRRNLFNQTEVIWQARTGSVAHTFLGGVEIGRQSTDNLRNTGYFNDAVTSVSVPFDHPTQSTPVTFRPGATDADNHVVAHVASVYAQDQLALSSRIRLIAGIRFERFDLDFHNNRTNQDLSRTDHIVAPRAGLVVKPTETVSLYSSYGLAYLPSSGDQFSSLTATTETLEPEKFANYEVGAKWDVANRMSITGAAYRLDRSNTSAPDPADPSKTVQTGSQRTKGFELGLSGSVTNAWQVAGAFTVQDAFITSRTSAAAPGAKAPLVPRTILSLWNRYQLSRSFGLGLGLIHQADMFAAIDNTVRLPSFTRVDAAGFVTVTRGLRAQINLENLFDRRYFITSNSNNNISPGSPRAFRVTLASSF